MPRTVMIVLVAFGAAAMAGSAARADQVTLTDLTISSSAQTISGPTILVTQGETDVEVFGTIVDSSGDIVYLNEDDASVPGASSIDDSGFYDNAPLSLTNGDNSGMIELFTFDVAGNATLGLSMGTYEILGGIGDANSGNTDPLVTEDFTIDVVATPESPSFMLLALGLLGIVGLALRPGRSGLHRLRSSPLLWPTNILR